MPLSIIEPSRNGFEPHRNTIEHSARAKTTSHHETPSSTHTLLPRKARNIFPHSHSDRAERETDYSKFDFLNKLHHAPLRSALPSVRTYTTVTDGTRSGVEITKKKSPPRESVAAEDVKYLRRERAIVAASHSERAVACHFYRNRRTLGVR